jgi:hypothetical protein
MASILGVPEADLAAAEAAPSLLQQLLPGWQTFVSAARQGIMEARAQQQQQAGMAQMLSLVAADVEEMRGRWQQQEQPKWDRKRHKLWHT